MKITLQNLTIVNFKGIRNLCIDFHHITNIFGENGTGKTTVFDAFLWLMFGKDSTDRKDFQLKPLDTLGKAIQKSEIEVSATILADGQVITIKRVLQEKWTTKRGEATPVFTGNETVYYWNEAPIKAGDFELKVSGLIKENLFKLITNTLYFNNMKWQDRRNVLLTIGGGITDAQVFDSLGDPDEYAELITVLNSGKSFTEYKAQIAANRKKLKDTLDQIPARIAEVTRAMPDVLDFANIRARVGTLEAEQVTVDNKLMDAANSNAERNRAIRVKQDELFKLQQRQSQISHESETGINSTRLEIEKEISNLNFKIKALQQEQTNNLNAYNNGKKEAASIQELMTTARNDWHAKNLEEPKLIADFSFDDHLRECPTCKQKLPADVVENKMAELKKEFDNNRTKEIAEFNTAKQQRLESLRNRGIQLKTDLDALTIRMEGWKERNFNIDNELAPLQQQLSEKEHRKNTLATDATAELQNILNGHAEYQANKNKIAVLQGEINAPVETAEGTNDQLRERKAAIYAELNGLRNQLASEKQIETLTKRQKELNDEQTNLAQQIADLDRTEFLMERFTKAKMDLLESRINGMFKYVTFKLFDTQINGGQVECCDALINGVPFSDANNASKINAGLDIINTLCKYHNVYAPIFIDNRESVVRLIDTESQIVNLRVIEGAMLSVGEIIYTQAYLDKHPELKFASPAFA